MSEIKNNFFVDKGNVESSSGPISSTLDARNKRDSIIASQTEALTPSGQELNDTYNQMKSILNTMDDTTRKQLEKNGYLKEYNKIMKESVSLMAELNDLQENGNLSAEELNDITYRIGINLLDQQEQMALLNNVYDVQNKKINKNNDDLDKQNALITRNFDNQKKALKKQADENDKILKKSLKSLSEGFKQNVSGLRKVLTDLKQTMDLSKLASMTDRSTASKIQEDLQRAYGLNKSQFRDFKKDVADSINTSIYSSEEVMKVYGELLDIGLGNADTASKQFNTLLQGQSLLGMQAETQAKLIQLGNKTGRDQLTFSTNRVAQYMKTATNLSKSQLNELIGINATLMSQLADKGYDSVDAEKTLSDITVGLDNYMKGDSSVSDKYRSVLSSTASSLDKVATEFNMSPEEFRKYINSGGDLFKLFSSGGAGSASELYRIYKNNYNNGADSAYWMMQNGILSEDTASLIKNVVDIEKSTGKSIDQVLDYYKTKDNDDTISDLEKLRSNQLTDMDKVINTTANWLVTNVDWNWYDKVNKSLDTIIFLLSAIEAGSLLKDIFGAFGKNGILSKFAGTKVGSKLFTTSSGGAISGLTTLGGTLSLIGGTTFAIKDAIEMQGSTGKGPVADALRGIFSGKTSKDKSAGDNAKSALGNIAKWTAIGAGVGTLIPIPGVSTAVGALAGAGIGLIGSGIGMLMGDKRSKAEQEAIDLQKAQLEEQQQIAKNTNDVADQTRDLRTIVAANRTVPAYVKDYSRTVRYSGGNMMAGTSSGGMGDMYNGYDISPYRFTSGYVSAADVAAGKGRIVKKDGKIISQGQHHGIDFGAPEGTPIGAAVAGVVTKAGYDPNNGGGYQTWIKGIDGISYGYAHQSKNPPVKVGDQVSQGQVIGYVGHTGAASGDHLHFAAYRNGQELNPTPYVNSSIFTATGDGVSLSSSSSNNSSDSSIKKSNSFIYKLQNIGDMTPSNEPIVAGLSQINQTLINLANRQSRDEQILNMLTKQNKPDPVF